jgi:hypothetical protein
MGAEALMTVTLLVATCRQTSLPARTASAIACPCEDSDLERPSESPWYKNGGTRYA